MVDNLTSTSGAIVDGLHHYPIRVYYEDTDAGGIVYHSQYLNFMERGRTEMLRLCGIEHFAMMTSQTSATLLVVKKMDIDFILPASIDDQLIIVSKITKLGAASMLMCQEVKRGDDILIRANLKVGILGDDKRPKKLDSHLKEKIVKTLNLSS